MEKWCYVVSDYCREVCPIAVIDGGQLLSNSHLEEWQELIDAFLSKHEDYHLRFICRAEEKLKLLEEGYSFLDLFSEEEAFDYLKKYKVIL